MNRKASLVPALGAAIVLLTGGGTAIAASGSHRVPLGEGPSDLDASYCGFPVHIGIVADNEYLVQQIPQPDGSLYVLATGKLFESVTNTATGKTIQINASGQQKDVFAPDGSISVASDGALVLALTPAEQAQFNLPGLLLFTGHGTGTVNPNGSFSGINLDGNVTNLCAAVS